MGDVAMTVPVLKQLTETYPELAITVVSKSSFKPIFNGIPNLNFVSAEVKQKHRGIFGLYKLFCELKSLEITHVADLHNVLRSKIIRFFFKTKGVFIASIDKGRAEKKELTKNASKTIQQLKTTHQRYADVFEKLGFKIDLKPAKKVKFDLNENILKIVKEKQGLWIGVAPFAAFEGKMYPLNLMKEVLVELSKLDIQILLFAGGKKEATLLEKLSVEVSNTINVTGKLSFEEELCLISNLDVMVSMDSGNAHLAAMFAIPTITIWGVTHPFAGFAPYDQPKENEVLPNLYEYPLLPCSIYGNKVFKGYEKVMNSIEPNQIVEKIKRIIEKKEL